MEKEKVIYVFVTEGPARVTRETTLQVSLGLESRKIIYVKRIEPVITPVSTFVTELPHHRKG